MSADALAPHACRHIQINSRWCLWIGQFCDDFWTIIHVNNVCVIWWCVHDRKKNLKSRLLLYWSSVFRLCGACGLSVSSLVAQTQPFQNIIIILYSCHVYCIYKTQWERYRRSTNNLFNLFMCRHYKFTAIKNVVFSFCRSHFPSSFIHSFIK